MELWWHWFRAVQMLRQACTRHRTFCWMVLMLAGLSIRSDLAGVSSVVRVLDLEAESYRRLLHLNHSTGLSVERLRRCWICWVVAHFQPKRIGKRLVVIGDGLKVAKEGRKMPAVKKLHQSSQNNSKASYIFGHSFQVLGLLVTGPLGHLLCVPLASQIHEGVVFSNRDKRTLLDKFAHLFVDISHDLEPGVLLVADAYYASAKVLQPLLRKGHQVLSRVRRNSVAYEPAPKPQQPRRGRPRLYGAKQRLWEIWDTQREHFQCADSPVYGDTNVTIRYYTCELLWRPIGQLVRFVWVEHPTRGRMILMCTDLALMPLEILCAYSYRFKIEIAFKQALYTLGTYAYHFWMRVMKPQPRRSGNQYLHRTNAEYRQQVRRKLDAYHRYVMLGCIAQGLLQYLALHYRVPVWRAFRSWLRTMNPAQPPSEAVVAQALRNALPEFLVTAPEDHDLKKFILDHTDFSRSPLSQAAA